MSRTLADVGDPAVEVVAADPVDVVRALRSEPGGDIWLAGGGRLAAALVDEIDELVLKINPLVLGEGVPLFDGPVGARALVGAGSRSYANGFVLARYRWARPGG